jgi:hypothetical protein
MKEILPNLGVNVEDEEKLKGLYDSMIVEGEKNGLTFEEFVDLTLALRFPSEE